MFSSIINLLGSLTVASKIVISIAIMLFSEIITLTEAILAATFVFLILYGILGLDFEFSIILGALAASTAPASTLMTIRQTKSRGEFVDTLIEVVAFDDVVGLLLYSSAISISIAARSSFDPDAVLQPLFFNFLVFVAGIAFGYGLDFLIPRKDRRTTDLLYSLR